MAQVHRATFRVTCDMEIPQYQKDGGMELDLMANDRLVAQIWVSGAHVYYRKSRKASWSVWTFSDFAKLLEDNKG